MDFFSALQISAYGMRAQSGRMRLIAENLANADSVSQSATGAPYCRKIAAMSSAFDRELNANVVQLIDPIPDQADFRLQFDPGNPRADTAGYVRLPNVNTLVEMMDMRDAQRSYEANIQALEGARSMLVRTVDLLRR